MPNRLLSGPTRRRLVIGVAAACAACLLALIIANVVSGWFDDKRPELSSGVVVGTWKGHAGSQLVINGDGTFVAKQLPVSVLGSASSAEVAASGLGRWSIRAAVNDPSERKTQIALVFDSLEGFPVPYSVNIRSNAIGGRVVLFWFVGDPDLGRRFILEKA